MHPDSITKTAFWYVSGQNQVPQLMVYNRMPFGLKNASAKFQRVMDAEVSRSGCSEFAFAYIDDLLIASDSWEEHMVHVGKVHQMLADANLKIHPDKSVFGTNIVEYLGHDVVGQHGIAMNEAKVEAIKALPIPKCIADLRSILGFLSYYRHFIPGFSTLTAPLTALIKKGQSWLWGITQNAAYVELRRLMTEPGRVLKPIDPKRELIVHTDWSTYGIGSVLGQIDDEGHGYLCACVSRSLSKHERNYPPYKGELLALTWAIHTFRPHVHGTKFRLVTDHQPLLWLMKARDLNGQYARWQMMLQEHDFEIEHRAGIKHNNADVLSRFPMPHTRDRTGTQFDPDPVPGAEVVATSRSMTGMRYRELRKKLARQNRTQTGLRPVRGRDPGIYDADFDYSCDPPRPRRPTPCATHGMDCPGYVCQPDIGADCLIPGYRWDGNRLPADVSEPGCVTTCEVCCKEQMTGTKAEELLGGSQRYCAMQCASSCAARRRQSGGHQWPPREWPSGKTPHDHPGRLRHRLLCPKVPRPAQARWSGACGRKLLHGGSYEAPLRPDRGRR